MRKDLRKLVNKVIPAREEKAIIILD